MRIACFHRWIAPLSLAAAFAATGCKSGNTPTACAQGSQGCSCRPDQGCDTGLTCSSGSCQPCAPGKLGCGCLSNESCETGLACRGGACSACVAGSEACACNADGSCGAGLSCSNGFCAPQGCAAKTLGCACAASDASCEAGLVCSSGICRACTSDVAGCPCAAGGCTGMVCDSGKCRKARTCADAGCLAHQACAIGSSIADATCTSACEPGFVWQASPAACNPDTNATCASGASGTIVDRCTALHRSCQQEPGGAHCGACLDGFPLDSGSGLCVATTCAALEAQCALQHQLCSVLRGGGAVCQGCRSGYILDASTHACRQRYTCASLPTACTAGQTCIDDAGGSVDAYCRDAACPPCNQQGEDGAWPGATVSGRCICKTKPGYFYTLSGSVGTFPCDADGDGWVRDTAHFSIESSDPAIRANARCDLRTVDRVVLHNDRGQSKTVTLAQPLPLYESVRNDDQAYLEMVSPPGVGSSDLPLYGPTRTFRAAEVNSLTKACVTDLADFNDNKVPDSEEWGRYPKSQSDIPSSVPRDLQAFYRTYTQLSYFLELHRGWYQPGASGGPGSYHIAERRRGPAGGEGFALVYGAEPSGGYTSDYWQDCPRGRDVWYGDGKPTIGMDFTWAGAPDDGWAGMMHHSQFKCVKVVDDFTYAHAARDPYRGIQSVCALGDPPATPCAGAPSEQDYLRATMDICALNSDSSPIQPSNGNPKDPSVTCHAAAPDSSQVGKVLWAAVRISQASQYYRGCMVGCGGFQYICPGVAPSDSQARVCYSLCGDFAASESRPLSEANGGYKLAGEVPASPFFLPLSQGMQEPVLLDPESGYSLSPW